MVILPNREVRYAEIGEGNLNWELILPAAHRGGVEYYLVEQDLTYERTPVRVAGDQLSQLGQDGVELALPMILMSC